MLLFFKTNSVGHTLRRVAIIGVGHSKFGRRHDALLQELAFEAVKEALEDAGITQKDIELELSVVGSVGTRMYELLPAVPVNEYTRFAGRGPIRVEAACATGSAAIFTAYNAIASGYVDTAIAIGVEKMTEVDTPTSTAVGGRGVTTSGSSTCSVRALYAITPSTRPRIWLDSALERSTWPWSLLKPTSTRL